MSLQNIANHLAQHGRGNDKMLVHMTPNEVGGLQQLAQAHGGSLTINPHTGLPEAGFLDSLMPTLLGVGLSFIPGVGPLMAAGIVGGLQAARTGDIGQGLMAGLGAYGGAGLAGAFSGAAEGAIGSQALAGEAGKEAVANKIMGGQLSEEAARSAVMKEAVANASPWDKLTTGVDTVTSKGGLDALRAGMPAGSFGLGTTAAMAATPMLAAPQTTTSMPSKNPTAYVQTKMVNPYTKEVYDVSKVPADQWGGRTYADERNNADLSRYITAADGGLMGMAPGQFNYAQMQPAVDLHSTIGANTSNANQPQNMARGGIAHFDDGGNVNSTYSPDVINNYIAQNNLSGEALTAAEQQFGVTPAQVAYAQAQAAPAAPTISASFFAPGGQGSQIAALEGQGITGANAAQQVLNPYTSYTPDQISQYVQQSGINLNDPAAIAAAERASNIDPAAYNAWFASNANPFSATALSNPTAANVSAFDATLGTAPANMDINNAIATAYKNTGATENLAGNIQGNTQLAREMDTWNVPPAQMAKATNHTEAEIQALYDAVDPNGKYASKAVVPTVVKPTTTVTPAVVTPAVVTPKVTTPTSINTAPAPTLNPGVGGNTGAGVVGGGTVVNPNGTITESPVIPGIPKGGFTGMGNVVDTYTAGGGNTGYVPKAPTTMDEFNARYNKLSGGSKAAFDYLSGVKGANYPTVPSTSTGQIMQPYSEAVLGIPQSATIPATQKYFVDSKTHKLTLNPAYNAAANADAASAAASGAAPSLSSKTISIPVANGAPPRNATQLADYPGFYFGSDGRYYDGKGNVVADTAEQFAAVHGANGGLMGMAMGGSAHPSFFSKATGKFNFHPAKIYADGGSTDQYNLGSYSDGGRLLRGPGDGVSDSIPATIGKGQPARLADGEFVVPARIVSELGNGSTDAGAKQLYAMMDRIQKARSSTVGKGKVATNTRAAKYLPA